MQIKEKPVNPDANPRIAMALTPLAAVTVRKGPAPGRHQARRAQTSARAAKR